MLTDNREDWENRPLKYGVTPAEMEALRQRYVEVAEERKAASDLNLLRALALGQALKKREG